MPHRPLWSPSLLSPRCSPVAILLAAATFTPLAAFAQPINDACINATTLTSGVAASGTLVDATLEPLDTGPLCPDFVTTDVWYRFEVPEPGAYQFVLNGPQVSDLSLAVTNGCPGIFVAVLSCTGSTNGQPITVPFQAFFNEQLFFRVSSASGVGSNFTITAGPMPPPVNDECAGALPLTLDSTITASNISATTSLALNTPVLCRSINPGIEGGADIFYRFTPPFTSTFDFSLCGSELDSVISLHSGCPATSSNVIACNDNAALNFCADQFGFSTSTSYLAGIPLQQGQTYYLRVAGTRFVDFETGELLLPSRGITKVTVSQAAPATAPTNDTCETATPLLPDTFITGTTLNAAGTPGACATDDPWDVWYSYTSSASTTQIIGFKLQDMDFANAATMSLYSACGSDPIACETFNPVTNPIMHLYAAVEPGATVRLRIAGAQGIDDTFRLGTIVEGDAASNLTCATAQSVALNEVVSLNTAAAATRLFGELACNPEIILGDFSPLWYSFTAPTDGYYRFGTDAPDEQQTTLNLYTACGAPSQICRFAGDNQSVNPNAAAASIFVSQGQTILARVAKAGTRRSDASFTVTSLPPPPPVINDDCATAIAIPSMPFAGSVDVTLAQADERACSNFAPTLNGIWYTYTPASDVLFFGRAIYPDTNDAFVSVWEGTCDNLQELGCPTIAHSPIPMSAGVTYTIMMGVPTFVGQPINIPYGSTIDFSLLALPAAPNDTCDTAQVVGAVPAEFDFDPRGATAEFPRPTCAIGLLDQFENSTWYKLTTQTAGTLTFTGEAELNELNYEPVGVLYEAPCNERVEIACAAPINENGLPTNRFTLTHELEAGRTYYLATGLWGFNAGGPMRVTINYTGVITPECDDIDFNNNDVFPEDQDVIDFFRVLAGAECSTCNDIDVNNNSVFPEDQDVIDFFNLLAGGNCPL
ncbi:MAG TPA: hypothetical protein VK157_11750 [Phycisphaerales bacterium]|nr:hypothetical protein [Phycisphaerales bacterium]